jgi:hypothetical protein
MKLLHRFWFTFSSPPEFSPLGLGCGITAYSYADAIEILEKLVFAGRLMPKIESGIEDVDIQLLDGDHVLPNMGLVTERGVWFPLGYSLPSDLKFRSD